MTIIFVDFGDFLDGVVARYWVDKRKEEKAKKDAAKDKIDSDDDSFGECLEYLWLAKECGWIYFIRMNESMSLMHAGHLFYALNSIL